VAVSRAQPVTPTPAGFAAAMGASVVWGLGNVIVTYTPLNGLAQATHRFWLGSLLYLVVLYATGGRLSWRSFRIGWPGGVALAGDIAFFFVAVKHTTLADAATIGALQPIVILMFAGALFGERITRRHVVSTVVALVGTAAVILGSSEREDAVSVLGELLAVGSLLSWAWYFIASKTARQRLDTLEYMTVIMIVGTVCVVPIALLTGQLGGADGTLTWSAFGWVVLIVLLPGSGHLLINWAHNHTTITTSSLLTLLIPVLSTIGGALWLDQAVNTTQAAGIAVVIAALAFVIVGDARAAALDREAAENLP
jgi:drug/metabolite transporter (DMT)-like permease